MANLLTKAFDDLFRAHPKAQSKTSTELIGWFKSKTGSSEAVAQKIASTFKSLAEYADFSKSLDKKEEPKTDSEKEKVEEAPESGKSKIPVSEQGGFNLVNRFEIHLPDTQNVETFRAIFRALREELMS